MGYKFERQNAGNTVFYDSENIKITLKGVNTKTNDANKFMNALTIFTGLVNWTIHDVTRITTEDVILED